VIGSWFRHNKVLNHGSAEERLRRKYDCFRRLLSLNNDCLDLMATLQEDLQYVLPRAQIVAPRIATFFEKSKRIAVELEQLTGREQPALLRALASQREEVERYVARSGVTDPRLAARLDELDAGCAAEAGGKAAVLGEIKNRLRLPVPDGFVITTEAYRRFCESAIWRKMRGLTRDLDPGNAQAMAVSARQLEDLVLALELPRAVEVAIAGRAALACGGSSGLAIRSSAVGEGGVHTFAGQFLTMLNVPPAEAPAAYRQVVAARYSERALSYRLALGIAEAESPLAVLFMPMVPAKAAGILYTGNPTNRRAPEIWITATRGLGLDIASGGTPADLFVVSRKFPHRLLESRLSEKREQSFARAGGGLERLPLSGAEALGPSLRPEELRILAAWAVKIEDHLGAPQDIEWALDEEDQLWILQSRALAIAQSGWRKGGARPKGEAILSGGQTVYPGRVSGRVCLARDACALSQVPLHSIVFLERASPEIARILSRAEGVVAEWGNVAGHAATLLRESRVPAVFLMRGAFERLKDGDEVSLDASQAKVFAGTFWLPRERAAPEDRLEAGMRSDPISRRILALNLVDPSRAGFRARACKSAHDVLRYCHEKGVEAMFACDDAEVRLGSGLCKKLVTSLPLNILALDLGGGLSETAVAPSIQPEQVVSRPFRALWNGFVHPDVKWTREMPVSFGDLASVFASSFSTSSYTTRALGERSFLLVARDYLNLNARLAYHFTLIDACLSDVPQNNYVSFRFAGGGSTRSRRSLRACFIDACLSRYGFQVNRRNDLVNAWLKGLPAETMAGKLDILGRLTACACQLDMYLASHEIMQWYVEQFLAGNYGFELPPAETA